MLALAMEFSKTVEVGAGFGLPARVRPEVPKGRIYLDAHRDHVPESCTA
jgi:hypothetical protein